MITIDSIEYCNPFNHQWVEEYYGYKCKTCGEFIPYDCEPWIDPDDEIEADEDLVMDIPDHWEEWD